MNKKTPKSEKQKTQETIQDVSDSIRSITQSLSNIDRNYENSHENKNSKEKKFWVPVWIAVVSTLINFVLAIGTFLLWNQAVNQSKSAETAAGAAKESVRLFEQNSKIENRAWVGLMAQPFFDDFSVRQGVMVGSKVFVNAEFNEEVQRSDRRLPSVLSNVIFFLVYC